MCVVTAVLFVLVRSPLADDVARTTPESRAIRALPIRASTLWEERRLIACGIELFTENDHGECIYVVRQIARSRTFLARLLLAFGLFHPSQAVRAEAAFQLGKTGSYAAAVALLIAYYSEGYPKRKVDVREAEHIGILITSIRDCVMRSMKERQPQE
jgi:hypothetical protein